MAESIISWFENACDHAGIQSGVIWSADGHCATRGRMTELSDMDLLDLWKRLRHFLKELRQQQMPAAKSLWRFSGGCLHVWAHSEGHMVAVLVNRENADSENDQVRALGEEFRSRVSRRAA